ncbi:MAG: hypothetical protein U5K84_02510 [Alkalibacterium sp.]|nr:hypothetical protein [Alkalibacterium sp.]
MTSLAGPKASSSIEDVIEDIVGEITSESMETRTDTLMQTRTAC